MDTDLENIATVRQRLNQSVSSLTEAGDLLIRARELALSATQTNDPEILALEVDQLVNSMLSIANSTEGGLHLYSGTGSDQVAFEVAEADEFGRPTEIRYTASNDTSPVVVSANSDAAMLSDGSQIFEQQSRGTTSYLGPTGAVAGQGTDNATGVGELTVRHTGTTYSSAVVTPGASSAEFDTVIGSHVLSIETHPTLGQVARLNGGNPSRIDSSAIDLEVRGPFGQTVFIDASCRAARTRSGDRSHCDRHALSRRWCV